MNENKKPQTTHGSEQNEEGIYLGNTKEFDFYLNGEKNQLKNGLKESSFCDISGVMMSSLSVSVCFNS